MNKKLNRDEKLLENIEQCMIDDRYYLAKICIEYYNLVRMIHLGRKQLDLYKNAR